MKGAIKERKGEGKGEKEEEEREKIFQILKKSLIFTKKEGEEKGEEIFTMTHKINASVFFCKW